jgi:hypothetical protein
VRAARSEREDAKDKALSSEGGGYPERPCSLFCFTTIYYSCSNGRTYDKPYQSEEGPQHARAVGLSQGQAE